MAKAAKNFDLPSIPVTFQGWGPAKAGERSSLGIQVDQKQWVGGHAKAKEYLVAAQCECRLDFEAGTKMDIPGQGKLIETAKGTVCCTVNIKGYTVTKKFFTFALQISESGLTADDKLALLDIKHGTGTVSLTRLGEMEVPKRGRPSADADGEEAESESEAEAA